MGSRRDRCGPRFHGVAGSITWSPDRRTAGDDHNRTTTPKGTSMTNPISFLFDWLLGLTRPGADPSDVRAFVANPTQAASQAMGTAVTQAQLTQAASAIVAPAAVYGADPIQALQHTVADNSGLTFAPRRPFPPETDSASHNDTALASGNDI